jgi:disulfide bond formation protein DsbB
MTAIERERLVAPEETFSPRKSFVLLTAAILSLAVGFGSLAGGIFGAWYTWDQAVAQDVTTPDDAVIPETAVRGPFTMWAQADIITHHQLDNTEGLYYSQMEREVPMVDENGAAVLDENGEQVMVPNEARASWIPATTLTTALGLGMVAYALAAFAVVIGLTLMFTGYVFLYIRKRAVLL